LVRLPPLGYNAASLNSRTFPMTKNTLDTRQLRSIAHRLKPIVTVAQNGLSDSVAREIDQALSRHELIKVKIVVGDRELRREIATEISNQSRAELVQSIGNVIVLYRAAREPDPRLSNILRFRNMPGA
jgi:RNA-binding protein